MTHTATARYRAEYLTQWGWQAVRDMAEGPRAEILRELRARRAASPSRSYRHTAIPLPKRGRDKDGIVYFDCDHAAEHVQQRLGIAADTIRRPYELGVAIQFGPSGRYLTWAEWTAHPNR